MFYFHFALNRVWNYSVKNYFFYFFNFFFIYYFNCSRFSTRAFEGFLICRILICLFTTELIKTNFKNHQNRGKLENSDPPSNFIPSQLNSIFQLNQLAQPHNFQFCFVHENGMGVV